MSTSPVLVFNKLYYFYHEIIGGTVFVDQDAAFVGWSPDHHGESDGPLSVIAGFFGVTIMPLSGAWLVPEDPDDDFDEEVEVDDDSVSSWCTKNTDLILEAIKQAYLDSSDIEVEDAEEEEFEQMEVVNHVGPLSDAVKQREQEEEDTMSKKKTATKKSTAKKTSAKKATKTVAKKVKAYVAELKQVVVAAVGPAKKAAKKKAPKAAAAKKVAKAKKPAKKAPVKGSKPAKGGSKKK